jgi:hypothetical protein
MGKTPLAVLKDLQEGDSLIITQSGRITRDPSQWYEGAVSDFKISSLLDGSAFHPSLEDLNFIMAFTEEIVRDLGHPFTFRFAFATTIATGEEDTVVTALVEACLREESLDEDTLASVADRPFFHLVYNVHYEPLN